MTDIFSGWTNFDVRTSQLPPVQTIACLILYGIQTEELGGEFGVLDSLAIEMVHNLHFIAKLQWKECHFGLFKYPSNGDLGP